ncbi:hypothetical protein ACWDWU_10440 [Streptomyces sp. NPDC003442]
MRTTRKAGGGLATLALGLALAAVPTQAHAASIACDVPALQAAIVSANATGGTIDLAPHCAYSVTDAQAIGGNAMPVITNDITLKGADSTIERAAGATALFRIFEVDGTAGNLTLDKVTLRNGHSATDGGAVFVAAGRTLTLNGGTLKENEATGLGGAIRNRGGQVLLNGSKITANRADLGGGLFNEGTLTGRASTVSDNTATVSAGGIWNDGTLTLRESTVRGNTATTDRGGGILNFDQVTLSRTTLSGNRASDRGGGIHNLGTATIESGKISENSAGNFGGGIHNEATLDVKSTAITANHVTTASADSHGGGLFNEAGTATLTSSSVSRNTVAPPGDGGGIYELPGSTVNLVNSRVADNTPDNCRPPGAVPGCVG